MKQRRSSGDTERVEPRVTRFPWLLAGLLFVIWLVLNNSIAAGHVALAAIFAGSIAWGSCRMRPLLPKVRRLHLAFGLLGRAAVDVARSNWRVARIVLGLLPGKIEPGFVEVPLELRDPHGLAMLGAILTATPGTVWIGLDNGQLRIHLLDSRDADALVLTIKRRYERTLLEIFER